MTNEDFQELKRLARYDAKLRMRQKEFASAKCVGKHQFPSFESATNGCRKPAQRPYRCTVCGFWHVGGMR